MNWFEAILFGIIQGATEFLPRLELWAPRLGPSLWPGCFARALRNDL